MIRPPRLAEALLEATLPADLVEGMVGDLVEEASARAERGPDAARSWLYGQLLRSAPSLLGLALGSADPRGIAWALLAAAGSGSAALLGLSTLWHEVLFLVPLRAGHDPTPGWIFFGAAAVALSAALGGVLGAVSLRLVLRGGKR